MNPYATLERPRRRTPLKTRLGFGGLTVVAAVVVMSAALLDVRLGLGAGSVSGPLTLVERTTPSGEERLLELRVGSAAEGRIFLFREGVFSRLRMALEADGVRPVAEFDGVTPIPGKRLTWSGTRPYQIHYAGLGRRVAVGFDPGTR